MIVYVQYSGYDGASPSGKASAFGADIRGFESLRPSQIERKDISSSFSLISPLLSGDFLLVRLLILYLLLKYGLI